jgi:peptidoglycan/LPS O-acetylase OafA/YrhL
MLTSSRPSSTTHTIDNKEHVIDAMRGFAALFVAYFHCRQIVWVGLRDFHHAYGNTLSPGTLAGYLTLPFAWGPAGVSIFFVISGYCIHRNAAFKLAANPAYRLDAPTFWARRFARIYPVLFAALLFTFALDTASLQFKPVSHIITDLSGTAFFMNLFSLQGIVWHTYGSNGALWTLALEVQFYAIYPLLFAARRRFGMPAVLAMVALVNVVSAWELERHLFVFFTSYWLSWTIGAFIADVRAQRPDDAAKASRGWYVAAAVLLVAGCVVFPIGQYGAFQLWAAGFACLLYRLLARPPRMNAALRMFGHVGDFSYSLYLIHVPLFVLLGSILYRSQQQLAIWPSFGFMAAAIAVAYLFYTLFERPAIRWSARMRPARTFVATPAHGQ